MSNETPIPDVNPNSTNSEPAPGYVRAMLTQLLEGICQKIPVSSWDEELIIAVQESEAVLRRFYGPYYDPVSNQHLQEPFFVYCSDHPEISGEPGPGYKISLPLSSGRTLFVNFGEAGRISLLDCMIQESRGSAGLPPDDAISLFPRMLKALEIFAALNISHPDLSEGDFAELREDVAAIIEKGNAIKPDVIAAIGKEIKDRPAKPLDGRENF